MKIIVVKGNKRKTFKTVKGAMKFVGKSNKAIVIVTN